MSIEFVFEYSEIKESINLIQSFENKLGNLGIYYRFPFSKAQLNDPIFIKKQIEEDAEIYEIALIKITLKTFWEECQNAIIIALKKNGLLENLEELKYRCILTFYGPSGYYKTPNIIFLNITKGNTEFMMETILHEILHIIFFDDLKMLPDSIIEERVDKLFVDIFGTIFPNYYMQPPNTK